MNQLTCSHHGILIRETITTSLDAKGTSKKNCFLCEQLIQAKFPDLIRGILYDRVKPFPFNTRLVILQRLYIQQIEKLAYHRSYYKILGKHHVADVRYKVFEYTPGYISTRSYYAKLFSFEHDGQL